VPYYTDVALHLFTVTVHACAVNSNTIVHGQGIGQIHKTQYLNLLTQVSYIQHICFGFLVPLSVLLCSDYEKSLPLLGIFVITFKII
jgi:hypothetical protein